jgi:hypothetical protein
MITYNIELSYLQPPNTTTPISFPYQINVPTTGINTLQPILRKKDKVTRIDVNDYHK